MKQLVVNIIEKFQEAGVVCTMSSSTTLVIYRPFNVRMELNEQDALKQVTVHFEDEQDAYQLMRDGVALISDVLTSIAHCASARSHANK